VVGLTPGACQIAGPGNPACPLPWDGDRRADAKTDLFRFVAGTPEGTNLPHIVRTVFGRDTDLAGADARLARRFFADYPELFETTRPDGYLWVDPTPAALHLNRRKQRAKNEDGDGVGADVPEDRPDWAKNRAQAFLSSWSTIGSDSTQADLLQELATECESIDDVWNVFERVRGSGPEYLCVPYRTRFNSSDRAGELRASWERVWERTGDPIDAPADLWKIALYWATGKRFFDGTGKLTDDTDDNEDGPSLPHIRRYRFVGVARHEDLPGYVRDRAAFLSACDAPGRPPPTGKDIDTTTAG